MTSPTEMTPSEIKAAQAQAEFEAKWAARMPKYDRLIKPDMSDADRAITYQALSNLRPNIELCSPALKKLYNSYIERLFHTSDIIPASFFIGDED